MTTSTRDLFRSTVADLVAKARVTLPESNGRIDSAVKLVLGGDVVLQDDGTALVGSCNDPMKMYSVNGTCPCRDFTQAPQGFCKHKIARALQNRTERAMRAQLDQAIDVTPKALPAGPTPVLPEAQVSCNVHLIILNHDVLVTLRGTEESEVLSPLETLLARYPEFSVRSSRLTLVLVSTRWPMKAHIIQALGNLRWTNDV
jgi:hypothetical protein